MIRSALSAGPRTALSVRPIAAPASLPVPVQAARAASASDPSPNDPAGFKTLVTSRGADLKHARDTVASCQAALTKAKGTLNSTESSDDSDLQKATQNLNDATRRLQAPVDAARSDLQAAWAALDGAVHPGLGNAQQHNQQADALERQLNDLDDQIDALTSQIQSSNPDSYDYGSVTQGLNGQIQNLERQREPILAKLLAASDAGDQAYAPQRPQDDPAVVAARARVAKAEKALADAEEAYRVGTLPLLTAVDKAQQALNNTLAPYRGDIASAQRALEQAQAQADKARNAYMQLEPHQGFFKRLWWKLFHGLDAHKLWADSYQQITGSAPPAA